MKTRQFKPNCHSAFSVRCSRFVVFPALLLLLLTSNRAIAAAPQIIPSIMFQHAAVDLGKTNVFAVGVSGDAPLSFQWRRNDSDVLYGTNTSLVVGPAQPADEGDYTVVVTNVFGAVTSAPARLWVVPPASAYIKRNFTNIAGLRLPYFYNLPPGYDPARAYPLVCQCHGTPGDESVMTNANYGYAGYFNYPAFKVLSSYGRQASNQAIVVWPTRRTGDTSWTDQISAVGVRDAGSPDVRVPH